MFKKHFWKILALLVVLLLGGSIIYSQKASEEANVGVVIEPHIKGNPDASVTLVEYSDFQCPACGQFYPYVKEVVEEHGDKLRFEYKHFPLITIHKNAVPAARAAEAASQQGKFFEMHDKLFENQTEWSISTNAQVYFIQYAEEIGLDVGLFKKHLGSSIISDAVDQGFNEARELGLSGTPTLFLNGEKMEISSFDEFRSQIADAVKTE